MALVASIHVDLGWDMPDVKLNDSKGQQYALKDCMGENGLVVAFTCNHCPYAIAVWPRLVKHAKALRQQGINMVAINPNIVPELPEDSIPAMQEKLAEWGIDFPYLADETQEVAKTFEAQCTPDLYMFDKSAKLYYHGRIDNYWKDETKVTAQELLPAAEALITGQDAPKVQHPTIGCSIKWKD
ncbi:MAG: thioredoxin family protein [Mariprofundaceae bacterium]